MGVWQRGSMEEEKQKVNDLRILCCSVRWRRSMTAVFYYMEDSG